MRTTIDRAGRIVIPKNMRTALGLHEAGEVELSLAGERIEIAPVAREVKLHRDPAGGLLTSDLEVPPHGPEEVREALERARR